MRVNEILSGEPAREGRMWVGKEGCRGRGLMKVNTQYNIRGMLGMKCSTVEKTLRVVIKPRTSRRHYEGASGIRIQVRRCFFFYQASLKLYRCD